MNKSQLINILVSRNSQLTLPIIKNFVDLFFEQLSLALLENNRIEIRGFGFFSIRQRITHKNFPNVKLSNSKNIKIVKKTIYFRMSKKLSEYLNDLA